VSVRGFVSSATRDQIFDCVCYEVHGRLVQQGQVPGKRSTCIQREATGKLDKKNSVEGIHGTACAEEFLGQSLRRGFSGVWRGWRRAHKTRGVWSAS
jgi:hypothetical protein